MKVSIIGGGGLVGSSAAFALQCGGVVSQIDLIDLNADQVKGQALDLLHGASLAADQRSLATGYEAIPESDVVVITAGLRRKPDESRLDLINRNVELFLNILGQTASAGLKRDAIVLVVSNPVDVLTYLAVRQLDLPATQVIGLGTQLDTARFRSLIAEGLQLPPTQVTALILGEHGDSMVPIWSTAQAAGLPLDRFPGWSSTTAEAILKRTRGSGAEVIKLKGGAGFAVGLSIRDVIHAVAHDQKRILPVSSLVDGPYGIRDVCLSIPTVIGRKGVESQLEIELWPKETSALQHSAQVLRETIEAVYKSNPKAAGKARPAETGATRAPASNGNARSPVRVTMGAGVGNGTPGSSRVTISGQGKGNADVMEKSLDRKLAAIHADANCREFLIADAKDGDMALGLGAPGQSPEMHAGEVRFKTLEEYRDQMRLIVRSGLVDIMLMSASSNYALAIHERLFDQSPVTPAVRANDTTDIHLARGATYSQSPSRPFRTASIDHIQCGHLDCDPQERTLGANLGLYSVTFNNNLERDLETLVRFHEFREEAERKGFRYFLEVFDPNVPGAVAPEVLPKYINDMITRMLAGVGPSGRPLFLKMVYHGPRAMEELVRFDPHLVVGILGGSSGTTRDAFQLLHDAQKYGARVALFGRKINNAENQLAFVHFLRLIVEGRIGPTEAVKAYHSVLGRLGLRPHRNLDDDLKLTDQSMSYAGPSTSIATSRSSRTEAPSVSNGSPRTHTAKRPDSASCPCQSHPASRSGGPESCACTNGRPLVTESYSVSRYNHATSNGNGRAHANGRPNFARMTPEERLAYHRERLGLGR